MKKVTLGEQIKDTTRLIVKATEEVTGVVETVHERIASGPALLGRPFTPWFRVFSKPTYGMVKLVTRIVSTTVEKTLEPVERLIPFDGLDRGPLLAALNGVLGDYLVATGSTLAIPMQLCTAEHPLPRDPSQLRHLFPEARPLLILLHGSSLDEQSWQRKGWNYGRALAKDCGYWTLYLRYNTGLHISENGGLFSELLDQFWSIWPWPIERIHLLGHSMGGLVAFSALHQSQTQGLMWRSAAKNLVTLGSPFHGSHLERGGNWIDTALEIHPITKPLAQLGKIRSAGVTDLRFGSILEEHWQGRDRFAWSPDTRQRIAVPNGVRVCTVAATRSASGAQRLKSDGLVPVPSALGQHDRPELSLALGTEDRCVVTQTHHLDLLCHPTLYATLKGWLA
jgi:pimeloyl-ACP methyl ester carboxylesterase